MRGIWFGTFHTIYSERNGHRWTQSAQNIFWWRDSRSLLVPLSIQPLRRISRCACHQHQVSILFYGPLSATHTLIFPHYHRDGQVSCSIYSPWYEHAACGLPHWTHVRMSSSMQESSNRNCTAQHNVMGRFFLVPLGGNRKMDPIASEIVTLPSPLPGSPTCQYDTISTWKWSCIVSYSW